MITKLKSESKVVGAKQVRRALKQETVDTVFVAEDAEEKVTKDIIQTCEERQIPVIFISTMKDLGDACSIDINAAVAALLK